MPPVRRPLRPERAARARARARPTLRGRPLASALGLVALVAGCGSSPGLPVLSAPLTHDRPVSAIAEDLDGFVPRALAARPEVPGLAVALVRDGRVAWAAGFGVADRATGAPVTPETIFQVASNSKPVAACAVLSLAAEGRLDLDAPLEDVLSEPWLEAASPAERRGVTARRVLSHSAGLSNWLTGVVDDRKLHFTPGSHFSYSGHGYTLLERSVESVSGESFADVVTRRVLQPLGMRTSGYTLPPSLAAKRARPHLPAALLAAAVVVGWLAVAPFVWLLARRRRTRAVSRAVLAAGVASALAASRGASPGSLVAFGVLALVAAVALALAAAWEIALGGGWRLVFEPAARTRARAAAVALAVAAFALLATRPALPVPAAPADRPLSLVAAGGLWASAPDLARFLAELLAPHHLDPALVAELRRPQVRVSDHLSWGLGIGIQHAETPGAPDALWHWGFNPGFYSLMVGLPSNGDGVVVLANGGEAAALELAREIAARALGGEHRGYWSEVPGTGRPVTQPPGRGEAPRPDTRTGADGARARG